VKERITRWLRTLSAKYIALFVLLVALPAIGISAYLLDSSYSDNKQALIRQQQAEAKAVAGRIDQMLADVADRLGSVHGQGLRRQALEGVLQPLILSDLTPLLAFYMDRHGTEVASVGPRSSSAVAPGTGYALQVLHALSAKEFDQAQTGVYVSGIRPGLDAFGTAYLPIVYVAGPENYGFGVVGEVLSGNTFAPLFQGADISNGYVYAVGGDGKTLDYPQRFLNQEKSGNGSILPKTIELPQVKSALVSHAPVGSATGVNLRHHKVLSAWAKRWRMPSPRNSPSSTRSTIPR